MSLKHFPTCDDHIRITYGWIDLGEAWSFELFLVEGKDSSTASCHLWKALVNSKSSSSGKVSQRRVDGHAFHLHRDVGVSKHSHSDLIKRKFVTKGDIHSFIINSQNYLCDLFICLIVFYAVLKNISILGLRPALSVEENGQCPEEFHVHPAVAAGRAERMTARAEREVKTNAMARDSRVIAVL